MKKLIVTLCFFQAAAFPGSGVALDAGGYIENGTTLLADDDGSFLDTATLRLEGSCSFGNRGAIETSVILSASKQPFDLTTGYRDGSFFESSIWELAVGEEILQDSTFQELLALETPALEKYMRHLPYSSFYPSERLILDRAMVKLYFDAFDLYAGRQIVAWGTGYGFNPTDIWNKKNPADPKAPKTGVSAVRAEIPLGGMSGLTLVASPGTDLEHTGAGFRLKGNAGRFDMSICGMRTLDADDELLGLPEKLIGGFDMAGQIGEVGVWMEAAATNPKRSGKGYFDLDEAYLQLDAGFDYTFEGGLYVLSEYYLNGLGKKSSGEYGGLDLLRLFGGDMAGFGRHYALAGASREAAERFILSGFVLGNLTDDSFMLLPSVEYLFLDDITVKLDGSLTFGDRQTSEFGALHHSLTLTFTGYF